MDDTTYSADEDFDEQDIYGTGRRRTMTIPGVTDTAVTVLPYAAQKSFATNSKKLFCASHLSSLSKLDFTVST